MPEAAVPQGLSASVVTSRRSPLEGVHVLVVDDDPDAREVLHAYLAHHGGLVTVAASGPEALAVLHRVRVDVVVSDLSMPGMGGHELVLRLRKLPGEVERPTAVIALTAFDSVEHRRRAQAVGFNAYLAKPLDPELLVQAIVRLIGPSATD